jgi:copper chaperone NosL
MRKPLIVILAALFFLSAGFPVLSAEDIQMHPRCKYCGMDRSHYSHGRMLIEYEDGSSSGTCSIYCAALDMAANIEKEPVTIRVADFVTHVLIDAENALWVIGGNFAGVMTQRAKWAFKKKEDALTYTKRNGGQIVDFEEALKATYEDMHKDSRLIRSKRKIQRMIPP